MNEKIEELYAEAKQATKIGRMNAPSGVVAKKFAELIVAECMRLNSKELSITAIERLLPLYREHFGVEE